MNEGVFKLLARCGLVVVKVIFGVVITVVSSGEGVPGSC